MTMLNGHLDKTHWLDKALEGSPPETKARVLEIILKYNIDPENEFFMIFVALGSLQILIERSPQDWQDLFAGFQQELMEWTQTNLTTLETLKRNATTTESFALTSKELVNSLTTLTTVSTALMESLTTSNQRSNVSQNKLDTLSQNLECLLSEHQTFQQTLTSQISALKPSKPKPTLTSILGKCLPWGGTCLLVFGCFLMMWGQQVRQGTKVQWLLEKANRRDCMEQVLPATDPLCRGL